MSKKDDKEFERLTKALRQEDPITFGAIPDTVLPARQTIEQAGIDYTAGLTKSSNTFEALGENIRRLKRYTTWIAFTCGMLIGTVISALLFILLAP